TYGIVIYQKQINNNILFELELNIGGFFVTDQNWLEFSDFQTHKHQDVEITTLNSTDSLILLSIEVSTRRFLRIRDLIDFGYITQNGDIDYNTLNKRIPSLYHKFLIKK